MNECLHVTIWPVMIIKDERWSDGSIRQKVDGHAMQCRECHETWRYRDPEDLPHWLYERLKSENALPMPRLTPEIMKALEESAHPTPAKP